MFYVVFNIISVISQRWLLAACDAIGARVLSAANTDAPYHRHNARIHNPVTSWHRANQSWFYPLNAERLARQQQVPSNDDGDDVNYDTADYSFRDDDDDGDDEEQ